MKPSSNQIVPRDEPEYNRLDLLCDRLGLPSYPDDYPPEILAASPIQSRRYWRFSM